MMLLLFGVTLIMLGLVGEYVGRIFITINRSPQYIIEYDTQRPEAGKERENP